VLKCQNKADKAESLSEQTSVLPPVNCFAHTHTPTDTRGIEAPFTSVAWEKKKEDTVPEEQQEGLPSQAKPNT
jgi:hypothetical protein